MAALKSKNGQALQISLKKRKASRRYPEKYRVTKPGSCIQPLLFGSKRPGKGAFDFLAEKAGLSLRDRACGFAAAPVERGSHPRPTRQKYKTPRKGRFIFWRRGWDSARSLRELPADMPLRGCVGRTGFSSSTHSAKIQNAPKGAFHILAERVGLIRRLRRLTLRAHFVRPKR